MINIDQVVRYAFVEGVISANTARSMIDGLMTKDMALKRCRELSNYVNVDHINTCRSDKFEGADCALIEFMRFFGIEESEL